MANQVAESSLDGLSDEAFMEAMDNGEIVSEVVVEAGSDDVSTDNADTVNEQNENEETDNSEDTDLEEEDSEGLVAKEETNDQTDDDDQETLNAEGDEEDDDSEENAHSEEDDSDDDSVDAEDDDDELELDAEDDTETTEQIDDEAQETDDIDYQAEYAKLKSFHDAVTSEFTAGGRKVKGFDDPKKIIQSQQMAIGFADKMTALKEYRPFMAPLKDRGMLDDNTKFDFAMQLLDGDVNAIKKHLVDKGIDPFELDMEKVEYAPKKSTSSNMDIAVDELFDNADRHGVRSEVQKALEKDWDQESIVEILQNPRMSEDLVSHLSDGAEIYNAVQDRIADKKRSDQSFSRMTSIKQYQEAADELKTEYQAYVLEQEKTNQQNQHQASGVKAKAKAKAKTNKVDAEKAKIEKKRKDDEYKAKVKKQNEKTNASRKKATSLSKKKSGRKPVVKKFNPDDMSDEELTKYMDSLIV